MRPHLIWLAERSVRRARREAVTAHPLATSIRQTASLLEI
jgi:hypothetical protein